MSDGVGGGMNAGVPNGEPGAGRRRPRRRVGQAIAALVVVAVLVAGVVAVLVNGGDGGTEDVEVTDEGDDRDDTDDTPPGGDDGSAAQQDIPRVETEHAQALGKWPGLLSDSSDSPTFAFVWAAWTDSEQALQPLWDQLDADDAPPTMDGEAILLAGTGESGSCPLRLTDIQVTDGVVDLALDDTPDTSSLPDDAAVACTDDFNPVTFAIRVDPQAVTPPLTVDFGQTAVRIDAEDAVVSAEFGERP